MNILPFVTIFLIILAIFSFSSFKDYKIAILKKNTVEGSISAEREARNILVEKAFQKAPKKRLEKIEKGKKTDKKNTLTEDHFNRDDPQRWVKISLEVLFQDEKHPVFQEMIVKILDSFYSHTEFYHHSSSKNLAKDLLDALIKKAKKLSEETDTKKLNFLDLYPDDEVLSRVYYKMLKGTQEYNLVMKKGYPPLTDFFTLDIPSRKPVHFAGLSTPLLSAIFGDKVKKDILQEEASIRLANQHRFILDETGLKNILHKSIHDNTEVDKMMEYFDFSRPVKRKLDIVCFEKNTHIKVTKPPL